MATYQEIYTAWQDADLRNKLAVAIAVAAENVRTDPSPPANQANRLIWSRRALRDPFSFVDQMMWGVLAANKSASLAQILAASDVTIQTNVDALIDHFATGTSSGANLTLIDNP